MACALEFSNEEQTMYEEAKTKAVKVLDDAMLKGAGISKAYFNALQQITTLRMLCNLGGFYKSSNDMSYNETPSEDWNALAQRTFDLLVEFGDLSCHKCGMTIESSGITAMASQPQDLPYLSACYCLICSSCGRKTAREGTEEFTCEHSPPCPIASVSFHGSQGAFSATSPFALQKPLPTKINAVMSHIKALGNGIKWYVSEIRQYQSQINL